MYATDLSPGAHTAAVSGGRIRVHVTWDDRAVERVDEYDMRTQELLVRKWRSANALGRKRAWEFEVGEEGRTTSDAAATRGAGGGDGAGGAAPDLRVSSKNPVFLRRDTPRAFVFRVRNLPYSREIYQLSLDEEKQQIVLRTTNRKYYKRFDLPALKRLGLPLETGALSYDYDAGTKVLLIRYGKPAPLLQFEMAERKRHLSKVAQPGQAKEGNVDCATQ